MAHVRFTHEAYVSTLENFIRLKEYAQKKFPKDSLLEMLIGVMICVKFINLRQVVSDGVHTLQLA